MVYILEGMEDYKRDHYLSKIVGGRIVHHFDSWSQEIVNDWQMPSVVYR